MTAYKDLNVETQSEEQIVRIGCRPRRLLYNDMIRQLASAFEAGDRDSNIRASVLASEGKAFCAGADFANRADTGTVAEGGKHLYKEATRLFKIEKPIVAAVHGAAIGGGLGLAVMADFRITCAEARFSANFARLGMHPGFGLTHTLPRIVGQQQAALLFYTGRRISGEEAYRIGLADMLVPEAEVLSAAKALAAEIAQSAPLAILSIRETLRRGLAEGVERATERELVEQDWQRRTDDFKEGVKATAERRLPDFRGK